jgi:hypothetical protein
MLAGCTPKQVLYEPTLGGDEAAGPLEAVLYLVGDAGEVNPEREDVLTHLSRDIDSVSEAPGAPPVVVAFLGDNIYEEGLPTEPSEEDLQKLAGQVLALGDHPGVSGVFLPGNHDWAHGAALADGRAAIARQRDWIERFTPGRDIRFLPDDGCAGPAIVDVGGSVHLVFVDTEWLLRSPERECGTAEDFYARLTQDLAANADRRTVVLAHHPLASGGPHGGNVAPLERGPFVFYLARKSGIGVQDLMSRRYAAVVTRIREAISESGTRPLAFAGGHDHTLQVIGMDGPGTPSYQLVSGAGSRSERTMWIDGMRYAKEGYGYMRLDFGASRVVLTVFARDLDQGPVDTVFRCLLAADEAPAECPEATRAGG